MKLAKFGLLMLVIAAVAYGQAQRHELALTLGGVNGAAAGIGLTAGSGTALQANYGVRLVNRARAALYGEVHFLSSPLREVTSANRLASRDFASLYVTPGVRVRFRPAARVSPWVSGGAGWALYENSTLRQDGQPNNAARLTHRGAVQFGGGVDVPVWRFVALRAEIRDFYTGRPGYNVSVPGGGQHNVVAGGGLVFRFGAAGE